jgi:hypothetical protein
MGSYFGALLESLNGFGSGLYLAPDFLFPHKLNVISWPSIMWEAYNAYIYRLSLPLSFYLSSYSQQRLWLALA